MDIQITPHFKLSEFLYSDTVDSMKRTSPILYAAQHSIDFSVLFNVYCLCGEILEPCRLHLGYPIHINSGYRCTALNKRVGGSRTSQHLKGEAADITCFDNDALFRYILHANLPFDQLIIYGRSDSSDIRPVRFIHVSHVSKGTNRKMVLYRS